MQDTWGRTVWNFNADVLCVVLIKVIGVKMRDENYVHISGHKTLKELSNRNT
jgi:ribosomal protein L14E/L6E/L27E